VPGRRASLLSLLLDPPGWPEGAPRWHARCFALPSPARRPDPDRVLSPLRSSVLDDPVFLIRVGTIRLGILARERRLRSTPCRQRRGGRACQPRPLGLAPGRFVACLIALINSFSAAPPSAVPSAFPRLALWLLSVPAPSRVCCASEVAAGSGRCGQLRFCSPGPGCWRWAGHRRFWRQGDNPFKRGLLGSHYCGAACC